MHTNCPQCGADIAITVTAKVAPPKTEGLRQPRGLGHWPGAERAVAAFVRRLEPGAWTNAQLRAAYEEWAPRNGAKPLTPQWLSKAIAASGAIPFRTNTSRGFHIPVPAPYVDSLDTEPASAMLAQTPQGGLDV